MSDITPYSPFKDRLAAGNEWQEELMGILSNSGSVLSIALNGTEHTHPSFVASIRNDNSEAAKFVRFAPDGIALNNKKEVIHWEAKCGKCIERSAYETYMKYHSMGCRVMLFVKCGDTIYKQFIERLKFKDSDAVVSGWRKPPLPPKVIDGWLYPADKWRTPYRYIDFASMVKWTRRRTDGTETDI